MDRLRRVIQKLQGYSDRRWYLPLLGLVAAADLWVAVIPVDALVVSAVLLKPQRWLTTILIIAGSSALGAISLAGASQYFGEVWVRNLFPGIFASEDWMKVSHFVEEHGAPALAFIAGGPLPQQPAVIVCGLAAMPLLTVGASVLIGRIIKYSIWAAVSKHAPKLLKFAAGHRGRG